ncbi:hypothetical protein GQ53DRAFT_793927 [Thozetella sp. PMI_491]|nr:hypothetical protein GQ53DRAFT_793927 [Thozetella sp. PMI_491]
MQRSLHPVDRNATSSPRLNPDVLPGSSLPEYPGSQIAELYNRDVILVCFGMIAFHSCSYEQQGSIVLSEPFQVRLNSSERFSAVNGSGTQGKIFVDYGPVVQGLLEEPTISLHISCIPKSEATVLRGGRFSRNLPCALQITIFGPLNLSDDIGGWFQDYDVYLQDPVTCPLNVKYCNPHRLSSENIASYPWLSEAVAEGTQTVQLHAIAEAQDFLDILSVRRDLDETAQPRNIRTTLKRFVNRISGLQQAEEPSPFSGGIIADTMGLGKTLTMIALVAMGSERREDHVATLHPEERDKRNISATLIILPPTLLGTWENQIQEHVITGGLKVRRHHEKSKLKTINDLDAVNVVLTTYQTVSTEWKHHEDTQNSALFSVCWRRIILDEAHVIRNGNSGMARAACELSSFSRWAVTGTPIQNRLGDLASLLKFIRAHPYTDPKRFDIDISRLWKFGETEEAVKRLQHLSACLLLRRSQGTIDLPARQDMQCPIDFNREERALYEHNRQQVISKIDVALHSEVETARDGGYVNVLQQIESLRLICNLGTYYYTRHDPPLQSRVKSHDWEAVAQRTFDVQREMGPISCSSCCYTFELTETLRLDDISDLQQTGQYSHCLSFLCGHCAQKLRQLGRAFTCSHRTACPIAPVSLNSTILEETPNRVYLEAGSGNGGLPSKIQALISDIKSLPSDTKCIVFSTWRLTLDIIEAGLAERKIHCSRYDGKLPQRDRGRVLEAFKTDPAIRVMLLTLSCGAVGLTLTVASRAYLMEPHWNPTLEEQALARIHRIGQTREVTTIRFFVRDSFEERVIELQKMKKQLAGVLFAPYDGEQKNSLDGLHSCSFFTLSNILC